MSTNNKIAEEDLKKLKEGAATFERFWLRPKKANGTDVSVRLRINNRFGGWKLRDGLVEALGLEVGDCINTEVTVLLGPNLIDDADNVDLFAGGEAADTLLDILVANSDDPIGCVIDCRVKLSYCNAPVGGQFGEVVGKVSLILEEVIQFVEKGD